MVVAGPVPPLKRRYARCHPSRYDVGAGRCRECTQLSAARLALGSGYAAQILGTVQTAGPQMPATCPKCHAGEPNWVTANGHMGRCFTCGHDYYVTRGVWQVVAGKALPGPVLPGTDSLDPVAARSASRHAALWSGQRLVAR